MKFSIFTGESNFCILHGQVFVIDVLLLGIVSAVHVQLLRDASHTLRGSGNEKVVAMH